MHYSATELDDGIWAISEHLVRCFLICGSEKALLLDSCASGGDEFEELVRSLTDKPIELALTHADIDHTGGQDGFGSPLLHPSEYDFYHSKGNADREVRPLWEGDVLELGDMSLEVLLLPGHTPGNIMLIDRANRRLFSGDSLQDFGLFLFGEGRSLSAFIESMRRLLGMVDAFDTTYSCHGTATLGSDWTAKTLVAAEKLQAGVLDGSDPPMDLPCKAYRCEGVTLFY